MGYISSLTWDEWNALDLDLQRLFVLLVFRVTRGGGRTKQGHTQAAGLRVPHRRR